MKDSISHPTLFVAAVNGGFNTTRIPKSQLQAVAYPRDLKGLRVSSTVIEDLFSLYQIQSPVSKLCVEALQGFHQICTITANTPHQPASTRMLPKNLFYTGDHSRRNAENLTLEISKPCGDGTDRLLHAATP